MLPFFTIFDAVAKVLSSASFTALLVRLPTVRFFEMERAGVILAIAAGSSVACGYAML